MKPFLQLLPSAEAFRLIEELPCLEVETRDFRSATGRVLAEAVAAHDDIPHFFRSNMDGFAVRAADTAAASESSAVRLSIAGSVAMGEEARTPLGGGQAFRVSTGAMMPPGADAVVLIEHSEEPVEGTLLVRHAVTSGRYTVAVGEDLRAGDPVFEVGHRLRALDGGILSGIGVTEIRVHRAARVGIVATGDEIVEPDAALPPGRVRNVNQYLMAAVARSFGNEVTDFGVIGDREEEFARVLAEAHRSLDVLFVSGGSSRGSRDLTVEQVGALPGSELLFHGLAIAPGKPTLLARAGGLHVMGLPGNPAAAAVVLHLFGRALVASLEGEDPQRFRLLRPRLRARLAAAISSTAGREDFVRVRLDPGEPLPTALPLHGKSVAISTLARAHGLISIPASTEGLESGAEVEVLLL